MALTVGTNSYVTLAEAATYCSTRANLPSDIGTKTDAEKEAALIQAAQIIEMKSYLGSRSSSSQALSFPRSGLYIDGITVDSGAVPQRIKDAQVELAISICAEDDYMNVDDMSGFSSVKVGPIEIETKSSSPGAGGMKKLPAIVSQLLSFAIAPSNRLYLG